MICKNCGRYNPDKVKICQYCGKDVEAKQGFYESATWKQATRSSGNSKADEQMRIINNKTAKGVLLVLFGGVLGFIIGLLLYPASSYERETFISGAKKAVIALICIYVLCIIIVLSCI